jgi:hypothetical protein
MCTQIKRKTALLDFQKVLAENSRSSGRKRSKAKKKSPKQRSLNTNKQQNRSKMIA